MARRHESLTHLSRDHHDGLMLARQILDRRRTMLPGWPNELLGQALHVAAFFERHLRGHFVAEEELLFPLIARSVPTTQSLVRELLDEHRRMEAFAAEFSRTDRDVTREKLLQFARILEEHIRKEERKLFPLFERNASAEVLSRAGAILSQGYPESTAE